MAELRLSLDEFVAQYGPEVIALRLARGWVVDPCWCGDDLCQGWSIQPADCRHPSLEGTPPALCAA